LASRRLVLLMVCTAL